MLKPVEKKLTGKQKAAIVLVALGTDIAAKILPHLNEAEVEELGLEIARLGSIPAEVRQQVIQEFYEVCLAQNLALEGGIDHARALLEQAFGSERANEILSRLTRALQMLPFDSIKRVHPSQLSTFLQDEHPQTIQQVLKEVEMKELALALKGASDALKEKIFRNMSERAVNMLKEEIEFMGPVRVRNVEEAQQRIVSIVRRLEEAGEIVLSRGGEDEMLI